MCAKSTSATNATFPRGFHLMSIAIGACPQMPQLAMLLHLILIDVHSNISLSLCIFATRSEVRVFGSQTLAGAAVVYVPRVARGGERARVGSAEHWALPKGYGVGMRWAPYAAAYRRRCRWRAKGARARGATDALREASKSVVCVCMCCVSVGAEVAQSVTRACACSAQAQHGRVVSCATRRQQRPGPAMVARAGGR